MKLNLTQAQLAALAAGAPVSSLGLTAEEQAALSAQTADTKPQAESDSKPADDSKPSDATPAAVQPAADSTNDQLAAVLRQELREANLSLAQLQTATADQAALHGIVRASIGKMQIALGGSDTAATVPSNQLLAEHERLSDAFKARFKVGGVAATGQDISPKAEAKADPLFLARTAQAMQSGIGA